MGDDSFPRRTHPEALSDVCKALRRNKATRSELYEDEELDIDESTLRRTISYGETLGFLVEDEDGVSVTGPGHVLAYNELTDAEDAFYDALMDFEQYEDTIESIILADDFDETLGNPCLLRSTAEEHLKQVYGQNHSDSTWVSGARTYLRTLSASGLGEYKRGRKGYNTRLVLSERFEDLREQILSNAGSEGGSNRDESETASENDSVGKKGEGPKTVGTQIDGSERSIRIEIQIEGDSWDKEDLQGLVQINN